MNVYNLAIIDGKVICVNDIETVMVHGSDNYSKASDMLKRGIKMSYVRTKFCGNCDGKLPCGCDDSYPQAEEE